MQEGLPLIEYCGKMASWSKPLFPPFQSVEAAAKLGLHFPDVLAPR